MTDWDASQPSSLLPRRPKDSRHQKSMGRAHHRRAHTAPHSREGSLSSCSSSSLLTCDSGETNRSSQSSQQGQRPSSGTYSCHISCRVSPDKPGYFEYLQPYSVFRSPLKRSRSVPRSFSDSYQLQHPDLNNGQRTYLWQTAAVYSMSNIKALQERRYKQLLQHQVDIGFHTQEECDRYLRYLLRARKRQYIADPRVWRDPPKIPVRPKSFRLPPPSKSQSPRDYRFFPRGYGDTQRGQGYNEEGHAESKGQEEDRGQIEGKGRRSEDKDPTEETGQTKGKCPTEDSGHVDSNEKANEEVNDSTGKQNEDSDSDDDQKLSESMQGVSLYYDPQRKTTITRGQRENDGELTKENAEGEGSQKSPTVKISHQNCFWGSH